MDLMPLLQNQLTKVSFSTPLTRHFMKNKMIKILAIDDNRDNLISLKAIISEVLPQSVVYMELSGQSGLESARKNDPDVILLDIVMPGMDGYEVCKTLKADEQLSETPVIFLTALKGDKQSRILALEAGGEAFLAKPIDATELKAQILAMSKIKEAATYKRDEKLLLEERVQKRTEELKGANIATLNLLEDLNAEIEIRKQREEALKESEKQYAFLAGTAFDLVKFTSIQDIYEYTARKLYELMDDKGIVAIVEYDTNSNRWKMQHLKGIGDKYTDLSKIFGFDIRKLEGEISTKYYEKITSGKLEEIELDFPELFNNKVSAKIGNTVMKLLSVDKMYCITIHESEQVFGNITLVTKKNTKPVNADLIEAFVLQITNYIKKQKSEEALRMSKELLSETESIGKVGGWSFNIDTKEQKWTDEVYRIHEVEISPEPSVDEGINYYTKESRLIIGKAVQRAIEHGENYDLELEIITAKGNTRAVHTIGKADLKNRRIYGFFQDITDRKLAEDKLKLLNRAVEASSVSVVITDAEGNINYVNPFFTELTGYSYEEALGKNPRILKSGNRPEEFYKDLWDTILSGKDWTGEFQNKKKNGELYWEKAVISPILNSNGKVAYFVAIKEDITEHKRFEDTRKLLLEISQLATKHSTPTSFLTEVHQKLEKIIRSDNFYVALYNEADQTFTFPYHVDEYDTVEQNKAYDFSNSYTEHVLKTNQARIVTPENQQEANEGGSIKVYGDQLSVWLGVPFKTKEGGKPNGVIAIQDYQNMESYTETDKTIMEIIAHSIGSFIERIKYIEELVQARKKAEESDKLKTAFINNISHEIRTPLNGILGFGQMLAESDLSEEERRDYFEHVEKSGNRLLNTVTDYMDMARLVSNTLEVAKKDFALEAVFGKITEKTKKLCADKNIEFKIEIPKEAAGLTVNSDPEFIQKILDKLLENAIKFTKEGSIICGCHIKTEHLSFFVKDTGCGIDEDKLDLIFEVFRQADTAITRGHEGSGLGLNIAKGLVTLLGGEIAVASEKGKGSVFSFTIPLKNSGKSISSGATDTTKPKNTEKPLILIAEDDESNYDYLAIVIKLSGYNHIHAANGKEAVDLCRQNPEISLVLMDIKMPVMNGDEATRQIRTFLPELPIIAATAHAQTGDEQRFREAGCNDYISKPINKDKLLAIIRKYVE
jgi:PAS domain S-box-containing protein